MTARHARCSGVGPRWRAAGALLVLTAVILGLPVGMLAMVGSPVPAHWPHWGELGARLLAPDDGSLFLGFLVAVFWAAYLLFWLGFTVAVVLEVVARTRRRSAPRLPGLNPLQRLTAPLVTAVSLALNPVSYAGLSLTPAAVAAQPVAASQLVAPQLAPIAAAGTPSSTGVSSAPAAAPAEGAEQPAVTVGRGDSLWGLAAKHLPPTAGEQLPGDRWPEIAALNYGRPQPDGRTLTDAHWIQPGWRLQLPADAVNDAHPTAMTPGAAPGSAPAHYQVRPGDSISAIAETHPPVTVTQLLERNLGHDMGAGARFTDPDLIQPGWQLELPTVPAASAAANPPSSPPPAYIPAPPSDPAPAGDAVPGVGTEPEPPPPAASTPGSAPGSGGLPAAGIPGSVDAGEPGSAAPLTAGGAAGGSAGLNQAPAPAHDQLDRSAPLRTAGGIGALLAASLLGLLAARRRAQQRRRRPGRSVPMPAGEAAAVEQELQAAADPVSLASVDAALRRLAADQARTGASLPVLRAARLTAEQFEVYLADPEQLPAPWTPTVDSTVWILPAEAVQAAAAEAADVPAPFPGLVTIGQDDDGGHVLVDLEHLGTLAVTGGTESHRREVLLAVAAELATSPWADDLQVTVVGAFAELEDALQTGRVRYQPAVGDIFEDLLRRAGRDRAALAAAGADDLHQARAQGAAPDTWTPEIVLLVGELTARQRAQLAQLVEVLPGVAIAVVSGGATVGPDPWALQLDEQDPERAVLAPLGLPLRPQRIDDRSYRQVLEVLATATEDDDIGAVPAEPALADLPAPTSFPVGEATVAPGAHPAGNVAGDGAAPVDSTELAAAADPAPDPDRAPGAERVEWPQAAPSRAGNAEDSGAGAADPAGVAAAEESRPVRRPPRILVLGPVTVAAAPGPVEPSKRRRLTELAAFLALHPGVNHTAIDTAMWPGQRISGQTRNSAVSRLRRWLGEDSAGEAYLPHHSTEGYRFTEAVATDWEEFRALVPDTAAVDRTGTEALERALALVRGRPFDHVHPTYYGWAESLKQTMITVVVDVADTLARRRLLEGRWRDAEQAVTVGLAVEPGMERLWRTRIRAAYGSGNAAAVREAVDRLLAITGELGGDVEPETARLLDELDDPRPPRRLVLAGSPTG